MQPNFEIDATKNAENKRCVYYTNQFECIEALCEAVIMDESKQSLCIFTNIWTILKWKRESRIAAQKKTKEFKVHFEQCTSLIVGLYPTIVYYMMVC